MDEESVQPFAQFVFGARLFHGACPLLCPSIDDVSSWEVLERQICRSMDKCMGTTGNETTRNAAASKPSFIGCDKMSALNSRTNVMMWPLIAT